MIAAARFREVRHDLKLATAVGQSILVDTNPFVMEPETGDGVFNVGPQLLHPIHLTLPNFSAEFSDGDTSNGFAQSAHVSRRVNDGQIEK